MDVLICSGDRDAFQLVSDKVTLLYPSAGVSEVWRMTPDKVEEKYGVRAERYSDLAALVGESSDNLPGRPRCRAQDCGEVAGAVRRPRPASSRTSTRSRARRGSRCASTSTAVLRNRRLNQLVRDVELGVDVEDLARHSGTARRCTRSSTRLEFRVLRERLFETFEAVEAGVRGRVRPRRAPMCWARARSGLVAHHAPRGSAPGCTCVGTWGRGTGDAQRCGAGHPRRRGVHTRSDRARRRGRGGTGVAGLADPERPRSITTQGADARRWRRARLDLAQGVSTTRRWRPISCARPTLLRPGRPRAPAAWGGTSPEARGDNPRGCSTSRRDDATPPNEAMVPPGRYSTSPTRSSQQLDAPGRTALLAEVELPLVDVLAGHGAQRDRGRPRRIDAISRPISPARWRAGAGGCVCRDRATVSVNLGSPKQLQEVLFDKLGLPKTKRTKTGYTTDAEAFTDLYRQDRAPLPRGAAAPPRRRQAAGHRRGADQERR
jgi:DNA polymerase-1